MLKVMKKIKPVGCQMMKSLTFTSLDTVVCPPEAKQTVGGSKEEKFGSHMSNIWSGAGVGQRGRVRAELSARSSQGPGGTNEWALADLFWA